MKKYLMLSFASSVLAAFAILVSFTSFKQSNEYKLNTPFFTDSSGIIEVKNINGPTLAYSSNSGVKILVVNGFSFKDLNKNGKLDKYEDWRLSYKERAEDLAAQMSVEQIAGLMLYSAHQAIPAGSAGFMGGTYNGKHYNDGGIIPSASLQPFLRI